jgi:hypothetical protein
VRIDTLSKPAVEGGEKDPVLDNVAGRTEEHQRLFAKKRGQRSSGFSFQPSLLGFQTHRLWQRDKIFQILPEKRFATCDIQMDSDSWYLSISSDGSWFRPLVKSRLVLYKAGKHKRLGMPYRGRQHERLEHIVKRGKVASASKRKKHYLYENLV